MFRLILTFAFAAILSAPAAADRRVAFVVGNGAYENAAPLANAVSDARLISETLEALEFDVTYASDLTRSAFSAALAEFLKASEGADLTLFYYAGHGMQFDGRNYLLGTDAALQSEFDIAGEALPLDQIVARLEANSRAALVFVDACRDNPLATQFYTQNFSATRALATRGLAPMQSRFQGAMLMFAASPGQVAYDGAGANSPFTASLARHLPTENVEILTLMKRVIRDVKAETDEAQTPTVTNDLSLEIYLNLGEGGQGAALEAAQEERMFEAALAINSTRAWDLFLQRYPTGLFRDMALTAREELIVAELAAAPGSRFTADGSISVPQNVAANAERSLGLSREDARSVQAALNSLGHQAGVEDGSIGPRTRNAIASFQADTRLPATGVVTEATIAALGLSLDSYEKSELPLVSSRKAQTFHPSDIALIETDERIIDAVEALQGLQLVYGEYQDSIYLAVLAWGANWPDALRMAERAGGRLASINSAGENEFVYSLIADDERFWKLNSRKDASMGPWIGLAQPEGAREPSGGWAWLSGEPLVYRNWVQGEPSNTAGYEDHAAFHNTHGTRDTILPGNTWGDFPARNPTRGIIIEIE